MILPNLMIAPTVNRGRGVYTTTDLEPETVIEISPVIVMSAEERKLLDQTLLHDYIFEWGPGSTSCCMALGYIPLYNHSYRSNCEYEMDFETELMTIKTVKKIAKGEELFLNYNAVPDDKTPLWFDTV